MKIFQLVPDGEVLIGLATEELAYQLLQVANTSLQNGLVHRDVIIDAAPQGAQEPAYPQQLRSEIELALMEALHWIEANGLLLPAPGSNGSNGFKVFGRRGRALLDQTEFDNYRHAAAFPKSLLHPSFADRVWITLARGEFDTAVFQAYKAVEEAVRDAGGFEATDIGVDLMRRAFHHEDGPLTDAGQPVAERQALSHLFAAAIGSYKNPHSHRTVAIEDPVEAQEMVVLASHLLRIVDTRRP